MEQATYQEYEKAKAEIIEGKKYKEHRTYCCADGTEFYETTDNGITEFWSTADDRKRQCEQPGYKHGGNEEEISENLRKAVKRIYKLVYWLVGEMLEEEDAEKQEAEEFKRQCEEEPEKLQFRVSAHGNNIGVLKRCMRDARDAAEFLKSRESHAEEWQIAGINAMFDQCNEERIVPYDLPMAIKGLLCLHISYRPLCIEELTQKD